jgi:hypothetical protein
VTLDRTLNYYHWGASASTADAYSGVDMRAEVLLLTRNVQIYGQDTNSWGCQVVTTDFTEVDGFQRNGTTYMDNVEIYNCSQRDTQMAALRFDRSNRGHSVVSNSAIHHGLGRGCQLEGA